MPKKQKETQIDPSKLWGDGEFDPNWSKDVWIDIKTFTFYKLYAEKREIVKLNHRPKTKTQIQEELRKKRKREKAAKKRFERQNRADVLLNRILSENHVEMPGGDIVLWDNPEDETKEE